MLRPGKEAVKEDKFTNSRKPCHRRVCGEFWNLRGQHNQEKNKNKNPQNTHLNTTASGKVSQTLAFATSQQELDREVKAA